MKTMNLALLAAGVSAAVIGSAAYAAAPAAKPAPVASYWMDVATQSGMGAGMSAGARPDMGQIMAMMHGGGAAMKTLDLRLASKTPPTAAPQANHWIPPALQMGASLPLLTPVREEAPPYKPDGMPTNMPRPKGRMLIYWGCGDHVTSGQPMIVDFAKVAAGQVPAGMAAMAGMAKVVSGPTSAPGFGRWPNQRDGRAVPAGGSLVGAHKVEANYAPRIAFSLGAEQDFMPALGLREAGNRLMWNPAPTATGYALAMFGANASGDVIMWSSASKAQMPAMDYLSPSEVKRLIAAGAVLPPSTTQCVLPAEVAAAVPQGMITMIGYGPEADFSDDPKAPKWTTKVRFKTTASLMHGMGAMMQGIDADDGDDEAAAAPPQPQQPPKKRKIGIGDILGAIPR